MRRKLAVWLPSRPRQRRALDAICDTFHPGPPSSALLDAFLELFAQVRPAELRQLGWLLSLFGVRRFERLSQERRERILLAWCNSRLVTRRAAFHGLRRRRSRSRTGCQPSTGTEPDVSGSATQGRSAPPRTRRRRRSSRSR